MKNPIYLAFSAGEFISPRTKNLINPLDKDFVPKEKIFEEKQIYLTFSAGEFISPRAKKPNKPAEKIFSEGKKIFEEKE